MSGSKSHGKRPKPDGAPKKNGAESVEMTPDPFRSGYDFLILNSPIDEDLFLRVMRVVSPKRVNSRVVVAVVTYGGLADEAYRIGRYLQSVYDEVVAFVPSVCKSAGTLLITAAHSVFISPFGELGPLDVQLRQKDEIMGRRSGLITRAAISDLKTHTFELFEHFMLEIIQSSGGNVSFRTAADVAARTTADVMSRVYEQINPDTLGQDFRDLNVATQYCGRLNRRFQNIASDGIRRLVHDYPAHDFVIDLEEAREIFTRVELPTPTLYMPLREHAADMVLPHGGSQSVIKMVEFGERENEDAAEIRGSEGKSPNGDASAAGQIGDPE